MMFIDRTAMDRKWHENGVNLGYKLPPPAGHLLRAPVIRWFRYMWNVWKVERHYSAWSGIGIRTGYDGWVLYAIFRGWC